MDKPLVSILCNVYNHGPFLRKCLEGFVSQQTDFPFEILIHDDASTDQSAAIIRDFEKSYPDLIKPIYQAVNQYSQRVRITISLQFPRAKGKYIAICEGDDYWTDPLKLQKQFDYMETHPDCTLCFTNAITHWYNGKYPDKEFAVIEDRDYNGVELTRKWISPTCSFFFRSSIVPEYITICKNNPCIIIGDSPIMLTCAKMGKIHGMSDITCVYGKHEQGWTQYSDANKTFRSARSWEAQRKAFGKDYYTVMTNILTGQYLLAASRGLKEKNWLIVAKAIYRGVIRQPVAGIKSIIKLIKEC